MKCDLEELEKLVENGSDILKPDYNLRSPLWMAVYKGDLGIVRLLLENGGDDSLEVSDVVSYPPSN